MRTSCIVVALALFWTAQWCPAEIRLSDECVLVFATPEQGRRILQSQDEFVDRMSPFDRAARMKTNRDVTEREYLEFVGRNVLAWSPREEQRITAALEPLQERLKQFDLPLPKQIYFVKTTGKEEGGAGYTRGHAIVHPKILLMMDNASLQRHICHELFHVLSRTNPELRDQLYRVIGFEKCNEVELPSELQRRKITNPDAPRNDHCIRIKVGSKEHWAVPILLSKSEKYNVRRRDEFFHYARLQFLLVRRDGQSLKVEPIQDGDKPRLVSMDKVSGFFEQVGRNTGYIIHPEEILADNFSLLIHGRRRVRSPKILEKMRVILEPKRDEPTK